MNVIPLIVGVILIILIAGDLLWTTLWIGGGSGPLTMWLSQRTWRVFRRVSRTDTSLSLAGPVILLLTLLSWLVVLWAGWTLVFVSGDPSLLDTRNYDPAAWPDQGYFAAYTMFTMGNGDFTPASSAWQMATSLATGSGMLLVTLSITYVLSVLRAVTQSRSFASGVSGLGTRGEELVWRGWNSDQKNFDNLDFQLTRLASQLDDVTEQHLAYPILHYYHSIRPRAATPRAVAILDDALLILETGVSEEHRTNEVLIGTLRSSIENYLEVLKFEAIDPSDELPPQPDLRDLREQGVPTVSDEAFLDGVVSYHSRRQKLQSAIRQSGRNWPDEDE